MFREEMLLILPPAEKYCHTWAHPKITFAGISKACRDNWWERAIAEVVLKIL